MDPGAHSLDAESTAERDHNSIASDPPKGVVSMRASRSRGTPSAAQQGKKKKTAKRPATQKRRTAPAPSQSDVGPESPPPKRGRPRGPGLTDEVWNIIVTCVRAGAYDHVAAQAAGISVRTFRDWIARGEGRSPRRL